MEQTACSIVYSTRLAIYLYLQIDGKDYSNLVLINMLHNIKVYSRSLATEVVVATTNDVRKTDACVVCGHYVDKHAMAS